MLNTMDEMEFRLRLILMLRHLDWVESAICEERESILIVEIFYQVFLSL
jgi:hypothetical protein